MSDLSLYRAARLELYRRDFLRYCSEQATIAPKIGNLIKLNLLAIQQPIEEVCARQWKERGFIRVCVFKARQRGGTTYSVARSTWRAYLNPNVSALIISCDDPSTENAFNKAHLIYEEMDEDIRPARRYQSKSQIVLENTPGRKRKENEPLGLRSRIEVQTAKNMNAGVGSTRQVVALSEMPRWGRTEEIRSSLLPTMPLDAPGTIVINEATPYGWGNGRAEFRDWCDSARSGKDVYELVELFWWMDPECRVARAKNERITRVTGDERYWQKKLKLDDEQLLYRRRMISVLGKSDLEVGEALFLQEFPSDYESAWLNTGEYAAFDKIKVDQLTRRTIKPPIACRDFVIRKDGANLHAEMVKNPNGDLWIWEEPMPGEIYDIGADCAPPSASKNSDYCAFQIIKRSNKEQVAEWYGHPGVYDYAAMLMEIGRYYGEAQLAIEVNGIGYAVNEAVVNAGYGNIYRWRLRQQAAPKYSSFTGWKTQDDTKKLMLSVMHHKIEHDELLIHSERLRSEIKMYIKHYSDAGNEKYEAGEGHDDMLDAFMIAQVISRDEDALGGDGRLIIAKAYSLKERNAEIAEFMQHFQPGATEKGAEMLYGRKGGNSPWARLAQSFGLETDSDE